MRVHSVFCFGAALLATSLAGPAHAEDGRPTKMLLSDVATGSVEQDTLVAQLQVRIEAGSGKESRDLLDTMMHAAVDKATGASGIRHLAKGGCRVFREEASGDAGPWVAEQELIVRSREALALLQLIDSLQADGMVLRGLAYELSPEGRRDVEDKLAAEAIAALRSRGEELAEGMGLQVASIEAVRVAGSASEASALQQVQEQEQEQEPTTVAAEMLALAVPEHDVVSVSIELELSLMAP